jgi:ATP-dependent exoDNAse (exonuclease V) alpha subunit
MTVAQFLYQLDRYDGLRQRVRFEGEEKYKKKEKTVVIDECSMLTMDDLLATLLALDLAHVKRVILVGDPNQLPPIGVGRPLPILSPTWTTPQAGGAVFRRAGQAGYRTADSRSRCKAVRHLEACLLVHARAAAC